MLERYTSSPNDSSARLLATLLGFGMAALLITNLSSLEHSFGQVTNTSRTDAASADTTAATDTDTQNTVATSSARSVASSAPKAATIDERVESRESGVNAPADYARIAAECEKDARGVCKTETYVDPEKIVVYKECRRPPARIEWGRFPECGIDEKATQAARNAARSQSQCLDKNGRLTTDRTQCVQADTLPDQELEKLLNRQVRDLTDKEEEQVIERVEELFVKDRKEQERRDLTGALMLATERIQKLLVSTVYRFSQSDRTALTAQLNWMEEQTKRFDGRERFTRDALQTVRQELAAELGKIQGLVTQQKRELAESAPQIENIITRMDDLVARVGTLVRDLERDGLTVPADVRSGYETAKSTLTDAKRTCSMRRPASCLKLGDVLEAIASIRDPLCALPSDRLTFCN